MDEEKARKKVKEMLDSFLKAMNKVPSEKGDTLKVKELRSQEKSSRDPSFQKRFFTNAKKVEDDCLIMEKGKWT